MPELAQEGTDGEMIIRMSRLAAFLAELADRHRLDSCCAFATSSPQLRSLFEP